MDKKKYLIFGFFIFIYAFVFSVLSVNVNADDKLDNEDIFFVASVDTTEPKEKTQVLYTLLLYDAVGIIDSEIIPPSIPDGKVIPLFDEPRKFIRTLDKREYIVMEFKYAIFPYNSGNIEIMPAAFKGYVNGKILKGKPRLSNARGGVNKYPFKNVQYGPPVPKSFSAKPILLKVQPVFGSLLVGTGAKIKEKWQPNASVISVGSTLTRNISIEIEGANPDIYPSFTVPDIPGVKVYQDNMTSGFEITGNMVVAKFSQNMAFVPEQAGRFTIPEVVVKWAYSRTGEHKTTVLAAKDVEAVEGEIPTPYPLFNEGFQDDEGFKPFYTDWEVYKQLKVYDESGIYEAFFGSILISLLVVGLFKLVFFIFHKAMMPSPKVFKKTDIATHKTAERVIKRRKK